MQKKASGNRRQDVRENLFKTLMGKVEWWGLNLQ
jgi:hypothetical protein